MRLNKASRKIRKVRKRKKKAQALAWKDVSFWIYLSVGLVLIISMLFVFYRSRGQELRKVRATKISDDMDHLCSGLILFYQDHRRYPLPGEGLSILVREPDGYLERTPFDPWGNPYAYEVSSEGAAPRLISLGSDGMTGGKGDAQDVVRTGCRSVAFPTR